MDKWTELKEWTNKQYEDLKKEYEDEFAPEDDLEISEDEMVGMLKVSRWYSIKCDKWKSREI